MLAKLNTFALVDLDGLPVEVDASSGLSKTLLVGLPEMAVRESVHRIERALASARCRLDRPNPPGAFSGLAPPATDRGGTARSSGPGLLIVADSAQAGKLTRAIELREDFCCVKCTA